MGSRKTRIPSNSLRSGFTLLELTMVMGIVGLLLWITIPAMHNINSAENLSRNTADIQSILSLARTQAMLRDAYVFVGFFESDGSRSEMVRPAPTGQGRLWIGVAATKDGSQGYDTNNAAQWSTANLIPVGNLRFFDNLHLATNATFYTSSNSNTVSPVGDSTATNAPFGWPIENSNTVTAFSQGVIQFTPQGMATLPGSAKNPEYIKIALIPAHGSKVLNNTSNAAVILVDAVTGAVNSYRP